MFTRITVVVFVVCFSSGDQNKSHNAQSFKQQESRWINAFNKSLAFKAIFIVIYQVQPPSK